VQKGESHCRYEPQSDDEIRYVNPESLDISYLKSYYSDYPEFTILSLARKIRDNDRDVNALGLGHMLCHNMAYERELNPNGLALRRVFKDLTQMPGLEYVWTTATRAFGPELASHIGLEHIATVKNQEFGDHYIYAGEPNKTVGKDKYLELFRKSGSRFSNDLSH
jgi:hypothetical protein